MTPLQIKMMLHYYAVAGPYAKNDPEHANSPAVQEQREALVISGLLDRGVGCLEFSATPKGEVYVSMLCDMPLPVTKWVKP